MVDRTDGDNIIHASTSEGIYDLTLGLSDKERWSLVALWGYDAAAITYGKAKEGAVEAHNFSAAVSVTSLHLAKGKGVEETPAPTPTLVQSVYSIGTSKVTKDSEDNSDEEVDDAKADNSFGINKVAIDGMDILHSNGNQGAMLLTMALMEETNKQANKGEGNMEEDFAGSKKSESTKEKKWQEEEKETNHLTAKTKVAIVQLHLGSDKEGSNF